MKRWNIKHSDTNLAHSMAGELKISPLLARLLINRGITDTKEAEIFLFGDLSYCYDPFLMKDMKKAVTRINKAIENNETILIYGDYDVDGVSSVALLTLAFKELGKDVLFYIPNRVDEGYGLNEDALKFAHEKGVNLIITVDCGINAVNEVDAANSFGIDVIITDHHEVDKTMIPKAYAIIDPHQDDCDYPFEGLAGVGVAYKLALALIGDKHDDNLKFLDIVALGTVADIVPQTSENRIYTKQGLKKLNDTANPGLKALIESSGLKDKVLEASHIGFGLGPRINAMGRIGSADKALELLLSSDRNKADELAKILNSENSKRRRIESSITEKAKDLVDREINFSEDQVIVIGDDDWHSGVIGIVASRLQDKFYRPSIVISWDKDVGKGSGRSIANFNLYDALTHCKKYLEGFGGHAAACGITINRSNIDLFRNAINKYAKENLHENDLVASVDIDGQIDISKINIEIIKQLNMLKPYGPGNKKPVFVCKNLRLNNVPRGVGKNGIKMHVKTNGPVYEAIHFNKDNIDIPNIGETFDLVYSPSINDWRGIESVQLEIKDIKVHV